MPLFADFQRLTLLAAQEAPRPSLSSFLIPFGMIAVLFYFMVIRPERRKKADLLAMLQNLKKNDRVITVGGIYGTIVNAPQGSKEVTLKVDENNNTRLRVLRSSISQVLSSDEFGETTDA